MCNILDQLTDSLTQTNDSVHQQIRNQTDHKIWDQLKTQVDYPILTRLYFEFMDTTQDQIRLQIWNQLIRS